MEATEVSRNSPCLARALSALLLYCAGNLTRWECRVLLCPSPQQHELPGSEQLFRPLPSPTQHLGQHLAHRLYSVKYSLSDLKESCMDLARREAWLGRFLFVYLKENGVSNLC